MVFTRLSAQEKDAFFGLLDEYFQSRPELFGQSSGSHGVSGLAGTGISTTAAASAIQRALAANTPGSNGGASSNGGGTLGKSNNPYAAMTPSSADITRAVMVGRVAAASLAFSQTGAGAGGGSSSTSPSPLSQIQHASASLNGPPSLPRRATSNAPESTTAAAGTAAPGEHWQASSTSPGSQVDKLVAHKASVLNAFKKQAPATAAGMGIPSAFVTAKNTFGPPPVRRTTSETGASAGAGAGAASTVSSTRGGAPGTRTPQPPQPPEPEAVAEGEWAEVLYDYSSEDPGDLAIKAGTRVFVTAKSSEDWWTGRVEGQEREGLFPASYVQLL